MGKLNDTIHYKYCNFARVIRHFPPLKTAFTSVSKIRMKNLADDDNEVLSYRARMAGENFDKFLAHFNRQQYCQYRDDFNSYS